MDKKVFKIIKSETDVVILHKNGITAVVALPGVYNHGKIIDAQQFSTFDIECDEFYAVDKIDKIYPEYGWYRKFDKKRF